LSFSTDTANLVADQLSRFVTLNRHQLAGQAANLDFWIAEARHALAVIDDYGARFVRMHAAQEHSVRQHEATKFELGAPDPSAERRTTLPRRVPDCELQKARRSLVEAAVRFLDRCGHDGLVPERELADARRALGLE
jgi:hypothetical protein